jgi:hypothetical protein
MGGLSDLYIGILTILEAAETVTKLRRDGLKD